VTTVNWADEVVYPLSEDSHATYVPCVAARSGSATVMLMAPGAVVERRAMAVSPVAVLADVR
jgi:hypothetical protein